MQVGFVVIGRNEGSRLERCLRSALTVSERVVYSDSASSDGSAALAESLGAAVVNLPDDGHLTAARGRNAGYAELRRAHPECDAVMFLDGDCILEHGFVDKAVAFLEQKPETAVVCGQRFEGSPQASVYNALCDAEWNTPVGQATECGGDAIVRCSALDQVGGYRDELRAGEEPEMTARMRAAGWQIWRIDALMTEHDARILSLGQWWRRTQRGGFGYAQVWSSSRALPERLYARQLRSAFSWTVALPFLVLVAAIAAGRPELLLLIPLAYAAQIIRIGLKSAGPAKWTRAVLIMLAKIPEAIGAARFLLVGDRVGVPEYKASA